MKVAIVNQPNDKVLPPFLNSLGIWTYETARILKSSCQVIVYARTTNSGRERNRFLKKITDVEGVHYHLMPTAYEGVLRRILKRFPISHNGNLPFFASAFHNPGFALQVATDLRHQGCDVAHVINYSQFVPIIRFFNPKMRIVLRMHCEWLTQINPSVIKRRLRDVDLIVGCSKYITEKIQNRFPQFSRRCRTIYNGVDTVHFNSNGRQAKARSNGSGSLLFVGRISPEKGLHILFEAFQRVLLHYPEVRLKIVGKEGVLNPEILVALSDDCRVSDLSNFYDGTSYISHLRAQLDCLHIADKVTFCGFAPNHQIVHHYCDSDVLINPSLSESFGRSLVEAMACQVPVIATRVGGMPEIVEHRRTGLLVKPADPASLAEAILDLLSAQHLRESMGREGRERVDELFSWQRVTQELLGEYRRICERNR